MEYSTMGSFPVSGNFCKIQSVRLNIHLVSACHSVLNRWRSLERRHHWLRWTWEFILLSFHFSMSLQRAFSFSRVPLMEMNRLLHTSSKNSFCLKVSSPKSMHTIAFPWNQQCNINLPSKYINLPSPEWFTKCILKKINGLPGGWKIVVGALLWNQTMAAVKTLRNSVLQCPSQLHSASAVSMEQAVWQGIEPYEKKWISHWDITALGAATQAASPFQLEHGTLFT